jgi:NAD(P)-dependent dehydrogenase (short-subunit alcohol dehydrogenase family)
MKNESSILTGKVALVTGAGPGNGRGIAVALARAGARVAVSDLRAERAEAGRQAVADVGTEAMAVSFDVTDLEAVRDGVSSVERRLGAVDILVNNAGTVDPEGGRTGGQMGKFLDADPAVWRRWIDLNIYGSLNCIHAVLAGMVARRWGRVIQISSSSAARGHAFGHSTYGAGKAGIEAAVRHIAMEVASEGVTLNSLALGPIVGNIDTAAIQSFVASIPVGRPGRPDEVGAAVVWLASENGGWVTAQTIHMNGGMYQGR